MPTHGGYSPYPRRFGGTPGGGRPLLRVVHDSLNAQRGTGYAPDGRQKVVWIENMAIARAIVFDGWGTNQRLANQRDPLRMTDMLPRWEAILRIVPAAESSDAERRAVVAERFARFGKLANIARLATELQQRLGPVFVGIEHVPLGSAVILSPDGTYPWGTQVAGWPWYSTVAHILIRTQKPAGYTEGEFYSAVAEVAPFMDAIVPVWATWDWYRPGPISADLSGSGGPSAAGFYLDDDHNLDNEIFDV